jgi:hypothetical protein
MVHSRDVHSYHRGLAADAQSSHHAINASYDVQP